MGRVMIERPTPVSERDADIRSYPVKAGESVQAGDVVDVVGGSVTAGRAPVGTLAVGSIVKLNVGGVPTEFIVAHHGKPSSIYSNTFAGNTILLMKDIYESRQWHTSNVNSYSASTIHTYLNGTFLNLIDADIRSKVVQVKIPYRPGSGASTAVSNGESGLAAKVWLLSRCEVGLEADGYNYPIDGAKFEYFLSGDTAEAREKRACTKDGVPTHCGMRTPMCGGDTSGEYMCCMNAGSGQSKNAPSSNAIGIRPALVLPDSVLLKGDSYIASHAIALTSGTAGQSIDVIFDGTAELPGAVAGTRITSPGVQGYCPMDGWVWVRPEWEKQMGMQIATGFYVGTGANGASNPNTLTFDFKPKIVIVSPDTPSGYGDCPWITGASQGKVIVNSSSATTTSVLIEWSDNSIKWYSADSVVGWAYQLNKRGEKYRYVAIG